MKAIVIKSTRIGLLTEMLSSAIWMIIPLICAYVLSVCSRYYKWPESDMYDLTIVFITIGYIVLALIALGSWYNLFATFIYGHTHKMVLHLDDEGKVSRITDTYFDFIRAKYYKETVCTRILSVDVYTPTLGTVYNTGTLTIKFVAFVNADHVKKSWIIDGVKDPEKLREQIIASSPVHEGLKINS